MTSHSTITAARHRFVRLINRQTTIHAGFTLPELLIASIIAAALVGITAQVMIGQLLEGRRLEAAQRVRENFSRLNYLIQIEASEANEIEAGVVANQPAGCPGGTNLFTLWVPRPDGVYADDANRSGIQYYNSNGNIERCGPPVLQNGVLDHGAANIAGDVVRNAQLVNLNNCGGAATVQGREVTYQVAFTGGNFGAEVGQCVSVHAKSVFVCNPPLDAANPLPTECQ